ncbi:MAG TPA: DinB family protein, partial [Sporichthya sp.]|nr:DinB family protein [Sporichthya sp.]
FGGPPMSYLDFDYAGSADAALAQLDRTYADWTAGVRRLTPEQFAGPCGEPGYEQHSYANLVLHINREAIHHGAEVALLRDLYAHSR